MNALHFRLRIIGILGIPLLLSCGNTLIGSDPADTPRSNFQILWENFDRYYALFEFKNIDWNALYAVYSPQVTERMDDRALFDVMSAMLAHLKDGHVDLRTPFAYFNSANRKPLKTLDMELVKREHLSSGFQTAGYGNFNFTYGQMSAEIGYIHIASFGSRAGKSWVERIDPIVDRFSENKGLIIDVRNNPGGDSRNAEAIAGRFADQKRVSSLVQVRRGPGHSDFSPLRELHVEPTGARQFTSSIVVLTDKTVASAAEYFVLAMKRFPYVTVIGDTTGGVMANNIRRELPNGWVYRVSIGKWFSADGEFFEAVGIPPDISVHVAASDEPLERDVILEKAIELLN